MNNLVKSKCLTSIRDINNKDFNNLLLFLKNKLEILKLHKIFEFKILDAKHFHVGV